MEIAERALITKQLERNGSVSVNGILFTASDGIVSSDRNIAGFGNRMTWDEFEHKFLASVALN